METVFIEIEDGTVKSVLASNTQVIIHDYDIEGISGDMIIAKDGRPCIETIMKFPNNKKIAEKEKDGRLRFKDMEDTDIQKDSN
tara:strand:- start:5102 stop:5353 length:252 start_codon:yes stop_codon:yes gene_type:complete